MSAPSLEGIVEVSSKHRPDGTALVRVPSATNPAESAIVVISPDGAKHEEPYSPQWVPELASRAEIDLCLRQAERRRRTEAEQAIRRAAIFVETMVRAGVVTPETLSWLARNGQSLGPDTLAEIVDAMTKPSRKRGARRKSEQALKYAFLMRCEIESMRSMGESEYDLLGRAAAIVRCEVMDANPHKKVPAVKRLSEIYRANEPAVEKGWPDFKAFVLAE